MIRRCMALLLVSAMLGLCSPVFAGDFVSPRFVVPDKTSGLHFSLPVLGAKVGLPGNYAAFGLPQSSQQQSSLPAAAPPQRHWSTKGKVLTVVGAALAVSGAVMMTKGKQTVSLGCSSTSCSEAEINWKAAGGITLGAGALLTVLGLTRRSD
jgi:hypothetical protein